MHYNLVKEMGFIHLVLEGDAKVIVEAINSEEPTGARRVI
jgi:hypothetical protein